MLLNPTLIAATRLLNPDFCVEPDCAAAETADEQPSADPAPPAAELSSRLGALCGLLVAKLHAGAASAQEQPVDAGAAGREEEAKKLNDEGGLKSPGPKPPPTQKELDDLAARINAADDDAAVAIARDPRAMELATPQQKAALAKKLMGGHTNAEEEAALKNILLSCKSGDELEQVVQMSGGWEEVADELDDQLKAVLDHAASLAQKQEAAVGRALSLLEQAQSPAEFERLYDQLGGDQLKHKLPKPPKVATLGRLEALGEKYSVAGVGFGMPPGKTAALQSAIQKAIDDGDNDAIVRLAENSDAMKAASPAQKARMIAILQDGWTKDSQDMAIARIITSCGSKAEFDQVVDMAGGPKILDDVDYAEAKSDINKMMGGFDRIDCADDKATAQAHRGVLMPPAVDDLTRTRAPGAAEADSVLGAPPYSAQDLEDPAIAAAARDQDKVRRQIGRQAYDLQADPMARNKLALTNRDRQLNGQPPLDYTSLVTKAYQMANDPSFFADVDRAVAEAEKALGKLDDEKKQEIREQVLEARLGAVAQEYGLSEQDLKTLVSAKMGRLLQEGAQDVMAVAAEHVSRLGYDARSNPFAPLPNLVDRPVAGHPQDKKLRAQIDKIQRATDGWANRLQVTGASAANLFKVPPSFAEDFVSALKVVGDVLAAAVNLIPGVGQAISATYFGVKAIVGVATGDLLGAFKSLLSAVPGVGLTGVFGAAKSTIETVAKGVQTGISAVEGIASGNYMQFAGAVGSGGGMLVDDVTWIGPNSEVGKVALGTYGMKLIPQAAGMIDGVVRGDRDAVFESIGSVFNELDGWLDPKESFMTPDASQKARGR